MQAPPFLPGPVRGLARPIASSEVRIAAGISTLYPGSLTQANSDSHFGAQRTASTLRPGMIPHGVEGNPIGVAEERRSNLKRLPHPS